MSLAQLRCEVNEHGHCAPRGTYGVALRLPRSHTGRTSMTLAPRQPTSTKASGSQSAIPRLTGLWHDAGLKDGTVCDIEVPTVFHDFDDYWTPSSAARGPRLAMRCRLTRVAATSFASGSEHGCRSSLTGRSIDRGGMGRTRRVTQWRSDGDVTFQEAMRLLMSSSNVAVVVASFPEG